MPGHYFKMVLFMVFSFYSSVSFSGIVVGGTRVIFPGNAPDATISIYNKESKLPYLIQSWVDPFDKNDKSKPPFTTIPPVSRLEAGQEKYYVLLKQRVIFLPIVNLFFGLMLKIFPRQRIKKRGALLKLLLKHELSFSGVPRR